MVRVVPRNFEAAVGRRLIRSGTRKLLQAAELVHKTVVVPGGATVSYYERGDENCATTILFCHGMSDEAQNLAGFIAALKLPKDAFRLLVPDLPGHGSFEDSYYQHPPPAAILKTVQDFLVAVHVKECHAFGYSMGGALVYFLKHSPRTDVKINKTVLVSPSLEACIDEVFVEDFLKGSKNHFCFESRADVKYLMRDLSVPHAKKRDPLPKFILEAIYREQKERYPPDHFRTMMKRLLEQRGKDPTLFGCPEDIDRNTERLVIWPELDFICSYAKGRAFFRESKATTFQSIPDCGHMFHSDGTFVLDKVVPVVSEYLQRPGTTCDGLTMFGSQNACNL